MIETVLGIIVVLLSLCGAVGLVKWAALCIAAPKSGKTRIYAVLLKGENADIELQMAMETVDWEISLRGAEKYAVDCGLDEVTREVCAKLCKGTHFTFLKAEEMGDKMYSKRETP